MPASKTIAEPEKELRFTRQRQGVKFAIGAAVCMAILIILFVSFTMNWQPISSYLWLLIPGLGFIGCLWLAMRCTQHAYLILSPLGIEIFPFFRAREHLQIVHWSEIDHAEVSDDLSVLAIHRDAERTSGVIATLSPLRQNARQLLKAAINGRMAARGK